jgi:acetyl esterase
VSPLFAPDVSALPAALIVAAEYDTLRDEAAAYAERLRSAGVDVRYTCYPGMVHGFQQMAGLVTAAQAVLHEIADFVT